MLNHNSIFMQDNILIHKAQVVTKQLKDIGVKVVNQPPYSPNLNPIKNLQKMLKVKIIELHPELVFIKDNNVTKNHLIKCVQEVQDLLENNLFNKLAEGMQKWVDAIKAANRRYTKY